MKKTEEFRVKFNSLKAACNYSPENFEQLLETNKSVRQIAEDLYILTSEIPEYLALCNSSGAIQTEKSLMEPLREYHEKYSPIYEKVWFPVSISSYVDMIRQKTEDGLVSEKIFNLATQLEEVYCSDEFIKLSNFKLGNTAEKIQYTEKKFASFKEDLLKDIEALLAVTDDRQRPSLEELKLLIESELLDIRQVRKVLALDTAVLLPRTNSNQGESKKLSAITTLLNQALRAFSNGAGVAALSLLRSITEYTLREYYQSKGARLDQLVNSAVGLTPREREMLHRLRKDANKVMHDPSVFLISLETEKELDVRIFDYWLTLRDIHERLEPPKSDHAT